MSRTRPSLRLAHGWRLLGAADVRPELLAAFVRPALKAIPRSAAARLRPCRIGLPFALEGAASRWTESSDRIEIRVATGSIPSHDAAIELLVCVGQALWDTAASFERSAWLRLLGAEIDSGVTGEMDDPALAAKRRMFSGRSAARSAELLARYAEASFAATFAEYVHAMWHDVTVRSGPEHLTPEAVSRRLRWMARRFPPNPGYRVFPPE